MYNTKGTEVFLIDGFVFHLDKKTGYYGGYVRGHKIRLHRYIWEKYNGVIPKGYQVHHKDLNKFNNNIDNLELLSSSEHQKLHNLLKTEAERKRDIKNLNEKAKPKAIEWHKGEQGKVWHRINGKKVAKCLKEIKIKKTCLFCEKIFFDNGFNKAKFCSNKCKSAWRRKSGVDNEKRICKNCGKVFEVNKYETTIFCSNKCSQISRGKGGEKTF